MKHLIIILILISALAFTIGMLLEARRMENAWKQEAIRILQECK